MVYSWTNVALLCLGMVAYGEDAAAYKAGDIVFPKNESVELKTEEDGQETALDADQIQYTVIEQKKNRLKVKLGDGKWAWLEAEDVVLASKAASYFSEQITKEATADLHIRRAYVYKLEDKLEKALADFSAAVKLQPEDVLVWINRGDFYSETKDYDKAIEDFTEAIKIDEDYGYAYIGRGNARLEKKEFEKALKDFGKALEIDPQDTTALLSRGNAYLEQKEYDAAIKEYNEVLEIIPNSAYAYVCRANAQAAKKDFEKALADYTKSLKIDPENSGAFASRGNCYADKKEYDKALKDFTEAIKIDPKSEYAINGEAWLLATCPEPKYRDGKKAVELAQKACELSHFKDLNLVDTLAAAFAEVGKFEEAVKWQEKAIRNPFASDTEISEAKERLELYKMKKPYRDERK
ncbi:tetratricopeptide repeat protein [Telmatocola sphagniphila]|uniref:Tetratricopeptide repeat protein n=1 Tax=Telmatocola sphagniphila TaxID=1123043 RepID=A0A8E6B2M6_9BACT|nr:tetratricopeptide repeat protein [Telmatocola sphagniphila]QVL30990.1 tetratricopeptide repeat protein [Telmatocola sphagniphila]